MRKFSLNPDASIWKVDDYFFSNKDLSDMIRYPDKKFVPWIHHFIYQDKQVFIKNVRGKYKVICNNFNPHTVPMALGNGYLFFTCDNLKEADIYFRKIISEIMSRTFTVYQEVPF